MHVTDESNLVKVDTWVSAVVAERASEEGKIISLA
jgi:hypothetical protein